jgi:hypothetical protein
VKERDRVSAVRMVEETRSRYQRNRVFHAKDFAQTLNQGKKPGFFGAVPKSCFSVTGDGRRDAIASFFKPLLNAQ